MKLMQSTTHEMNATRATCNLFIWSYDSYGGKFLKTNIAGGGNISWKLRLGCLCFCNCADITFDAAPHCQLKEMRVYNFSNITDVFFGQNCVGFCKCKKFGPGATFWFFPSSFSWSWNEWRKTQMKMSIWLWSMRRFHVSKYVPHPAPTTYKSDRLRGHWLHCVCAVLCQPAECKMHCIHWKLCTAQMRYPMDKWNALGAWCQMTSAGKYTYTPNSFVI